MADNKELGSIMRYGVVSAYDAKRHMARVQFPDKDNLVSAWLPVVVPNSLKNHDELHLDINEHVVCMITGNGIEAGAVLGAIYDDTNNPPEGSQDIRKVTFSDGTEILYNRATHELNINCVGDINIHAGGNINITGARIDLN